MGNGAPFDFFELFDHIVDSSADAYEKLIALILARHIGKNSEPAFPARARILKKASCSLNTFKRSQAALAAFFTAEPRNGRATLYAPKPLVTTDEIEIAIRAAREESRSLTEAGPPQSRTPTGTGFAKSRTATGSPPGTPQVPHNDSLKPTTLNVARDRASLDVLEAKLLTACNGAAANPAIAPAILVLSEPIKWLEAGCDLELDILPTIKARAHKIRPGSIKNWSYFTQAVADARANREAPMPPGEAKPAAAAKPQGNYSYSGNYTGRRM